MGPCSVRVVQRVLPNKLSIYLSIRLSVPACQARRALPQGRWRVALAALARAASPPVQSKAQACEWQSFAWGRLVRGSSPVWHTGGRSARHLAGWMAVCGGLRSHLMGSSSTSSVDCGPHLVGVRVGVTVTVTVGVGVGVRVGFRVRVRVSTRPSRGRPRRRRPPAWPLPRAHLRSRRPLRLWQCPSQHPPAFCFRVRRPASVRQRRGTAS